MHHRFLLLLVATACGVAVACSAAGSGDGQGAGPGDQGAGDDAGERGAGGGGPEPDFGPEGQPDCPAPHFCLEFPSVTTASLHALATTPAGGLWAIGDGGTLLHSKSGGKSWSRVTSPKPGSALRSVAVAGSTVVVVGDDGTILRLDGTSFRVDAIDGTPSLAATWAAGPRDIWAVGTDTPEGGAPHGVVLHFDGTHWSHVGDGALPPLAAVNGSSPDDVWIGGGEYDSIALLHLESGAWTAFDDPQASLSRQVEPPIAAIAALGPKDIVVATGGPNFSNVLHFDGTTWTDEDDRLRDQGASISGFVRAADGALWTVAEPPRIRHGKTWSDAPGKWGFGAPMNAIAFLSGATVVAGDHGLLGRTDDGALAGPFGGVYTAKAFANGSVILSSGRLMTSDASGYHTIVEDPYLSWMDANALDDVAAISFEQGDDVTDPNRGLIAFRWNGAKASVVQNVSALQQNVTPLALTPNGDLWWTTTTYSDDLLKHTAVVGKVARGSSSVATVKCNGADWEGTVLYSDGKDILARSDDGVTTSKVLHIDSAGVCHEVTSQPLMYWQDGGAIGGTGFGDLWAIEPYDTKSSLLQHWDGTAAKVAFTAPVNLCAMKFFAANDIWLMPCGGEGPDTNVYHFDGVKLDAVATTKSSTPPAYTYPWIVWGTDAAHLWIGNGEGTILRYKP